MSTGLDGFCKVAKDAEGALPLANFGVVKTLINLCGCMHKARIIILIFILLISFNENLYSSSHGQS